MKYTKAPKNTVYLGHFKDCLKVGHNTNLMSEIDGSIPKKDEKKTPKTPLPGGIRG